MLRLPLALATALGICIVMPSIVTRATIPSCLLWLLLWFLIIFAPYTWQQLPQALHFAHLPGYNIGWLWVFAKVLIVIDTFLPMDGQYFTTLHLFCYYHRQRCCFQIRIQWQFLLFLFVTRNESTCMASLPTVLYQPQLVWEPFPTLYAQCIQSIILGVVGTVDSDVYRFLEKLVIYTKGISHCSINLLFPMFTWKRTRPSWAMAVEDSRASLLVAIVDSAFKVGTVVTDEQSITVR